MVLLNMFTTKTLEVPVAHPPNFMAVSAKTYFYTMERNSFIEISIYRPRAQTVVSARRVVVEAVVANRMWGETRSS